MAATATMAMCLLDCVLCAAVIVRNAAVHDGANLNRKDRDLGKGTRCLLQRRLLLQKETPLSFCLSIEEISYHTVRNPAYLDTNQTLCGLIACGTPREIGGRHVKQI